MNVTIAKKNICFNYSKLVWLSKSPKVFLFLKKTFKQNDLTWHSRRHDRDT